MIPRADSPFSNKRVALQANDELPTSAGNPNANKSVIWVSEELSMRATLFFMPDGFPTDELIQEITPAEFTDEL